MKDDGLIVGFMLERIALIQQFTQSLRAIFFASALVQSATLREMQLLTDASKRLSAEAKQQMPDIPWREISGFRNFWCMNIWAN